MKKVGLDMMLGRQTHCLYKKRIPKTVIVRACLVAGEATKAPPFGSTLGLYGVKGDDFCNFFNTDSLKYWAKGTVVSVVILISPSKSYIIEYQLPPVSSMLDASFLLEEEEPRITSKTLTKNYNVAYDWQKIIDDVREKFLCAVNEIDIAIYNECKKLNEVSRVIENSSRKTQGLLPNKNLDNKTKITWKLFNEEIRLLEKELAIKERKKNAERRRKRKKLILMEKISLLAVKRKGLFSKYIDGPERESRNWLKSTVNNRYESIYRKTYRYVKKMREVWSEFHKIAIIKSQQTNPIILKQYLKQIVGSFHSCNLQNPLRKEKRNYYWKGGKK